MKGIKIKWVVSTVLFFTALHATAQLTGSAFAMAGATIVNPVGLSSDNTLTFTAVLQEPINNNIKSGKKQFSLTAATFNIDAAPGDIYSITMPGELAFQHMTNSSCFTALVNLKQPDARQSTSTGINIYAVNSDLTLQVNNVVGKYSSSPFEVTVNFN